MCGEPSDPPYDKRLSTAHEIPGIMPLASLSNEPVIGKSFANEVKTSRLQDPVLLIPTSGSTGTPKLIIVNSKMILRQLIPPRLGVRRILFSHQPLR